MHSTQHTQYLIGLGRKIAELRKKQNLTKVQLAFEINTSEKYIRQVEKGELNIRVITLLKLSDALNIEIKELFDFNFEE